VLLTECLVRLEDAGGERAGIDRRVVAAHDAFQAVWVGEDQAGEAGLVAELLEPAVGLGRRRPGELGVFVGVDHREEVFAAGQGLLGLDLGAEPGIGGT
jgi:hypothetical protein